MRYEISKLETVDALNIARKLNELQVEEAFDFYANMKWVRPFGMLLASSAIKSFRNKYPEISFKMDFNDGKSGLDYAGHMGFFKAISDKIDFGKMPGGAKGNDNYIPITELDLSEIHKKEIENGNFVEMGDAVEKESARLAKILSRNNEELHKLLTYLIREILRNIPEHSDSCKAFVCGQYWSDETAEIAILDEGIGILNSLQKNQTHRKYIENDEEAIEYAIKAGISKAFQPSKTNKSEEVWSNSGFGLFMVSEICKELNGSFCLASGSKYIILYRDGSLRIGDTAFKGTAIKIAISTNDVLDSSDLISRIADRGAEQAKTIRNAFKTASVPSKGLISSL